eukprot:TRINITY_DN3374_c0_g2_i2.p1 TRINITY_DN3374_c0_g2~~TRINITY_DN3374_c0_g2_i2.p1  ORF type:complete len:447 (-),score=85.23 TRINITY_DN3374_c0_g2_i2:207-1547(-)
MWRDALGEVLLLVPHPSPFLIDVMVEFNSVHLRVDYEQNLNDLATLLMLARIITIIRAVLMHAKYFNGSSQRVCLMYAVRPSVFFVIKSYFKAYPIKMISISLLSSIVYFGYAIRLCERPIMFHVSDFTFDSYFNCFWYVIVTMTTVGYGDYYPRTVLGRAIAFMICIWGVFIVSMMVLTLSNLLNMDNLEAKAFSIIERMSMRRDMKHTASLLLTSLAKYHVVKRRNPQLDQNSRLCRIKDLLDNFKHQARVYRSALDDGNVSELVERRFDQMREEMLMMQRKQNLLLDITALLLQQSQLGATESIRSRLKEFADDNPEMNAKDSHVKQAKDDAPLNTSKDVADKEKYVKEGDAGIDTKRSGGGFDALEELKAHVNSIIDGASEANVILPPMSAPFSGLGDQSSFNFTRIQEFDSLGPKQVRSNHVNKQKIHAQIHKVHTHQICP